MEEIKNNEQDEGKTLFEHLGFDESKTNKYMKKGKKIMILIGSGAITGVIIDILLETDKFYIILPLLILLVLILKWYKQK